MSVYSSSAWPSWRLHLDDLSLVYAGARPYRVDLAALTTPGARLAALRHANRLGARASEELAHAISSLLGDPGEESDRLAADELRARVRIFIAEHIEANPAKGQPR